MSDLFDDMAQSVVSGSWGRLTRDEPKWDKYGFRVEPNTEALAELIAAKLREVRDAIAEMVDTGGYEERLVGRIGSPDDIWREDVVKAIRAYGEGAQDR